MRTFPCPFLESLAISHDLKIAERYAKSGGKMVKTGTVYALIGNIFDTKDLYGLVQ